MTTAQLAEAVAALGKAMRAQGMAAPLPSLRLFLLALRKGLTGDGHRVQVDWSEQLVIDWCRALGVPPFDVEVKEAGVPCLKCKAGKGGRPEPVPVIRWDGGALLRCPVCDARWIALGPPREPPKGAGPSFAEARIAMGRGRR